MLDNVNIRANKSYKSGWMGLRSVPITLADG